MTPNIFVIVAAYKGKRWYDRCFSSILKSTVPVQTIVIDNSCDGSAAYIRENYPDTILFESETNIGFGRANNIGIKYALKNGGDFVFLLNQDAWIEEDTIERMIQIYNGHNDYGVLGCTNLTKEKDHILKGFFPVMWDQEYDHPLIDDMFFHRLKDIYEVRSIPAAAWLLPRTTLEIVGGFDPIFFHYGEDDNYQQRVHYHGLKIGICPNCCIVHDAEDVKLDEALTLRQKEHAEKREWLLEMCDIRDCRSIGKRIGIATVQFIKSILSFKKTRSSNSFRKLLFLLKNRKAIEQSIAVNIKAGRSHL